MPPFRFQPGDIAACFGTDRASWIISLGTMSPIAPAGLRFGPSHVALLCKPPVERTLSEAFAEAAGAVAINAKFNNAASARACTFDDAPTNTATENRKLNTENYFWIESTTMCRHPCLLRNKRVSGVQAHQPHRRIADYTNDGGRVDIYRLSPIDRLSRDESRLLTTILVDHFVKRNIDYDLGGALLSGTRVLKLSRLLSSDLNQVFCSELVAAVFQRLGRMNRQNPTRHNPASLLRQLVRQGTYQRVVSFQRPPEVTFPRAPQNRFIVSHADTPLWAWSPDPPTEL